MTLSYAILFLVLGLAIGSFLNVVILRIDDLKSILSDRSHCPKCKEILKWYDLVPFLSFIMLKAKCRYCGEKISWQYPVVEISTGLLFLFLFLTLGLSWALIYYLVIFSILIVVFVYDIKTQTVPEVFVWIALILSFFGGWYFGGFQIVSMLLGGLVGGGFLALLVYISKEKWMGAGDIKIGLILGFLTGYPAVLFTLFIAFILGSIVGVIYILYKDKQINKQALKESLPFAPFLIFATIIGITYGNMIVSWYLSLLKI